MSDTPTKTVAKRAPAKRAAPPPPDDTSVFVIEPINRRYRYMFRGGKLMDVISPYAANSTDREKVLEEAKRRWGGKKDDWMIVGSTELP